MNGSAALAVMASSERRSMSRDFMAGILCAGGRDGNAEVRRGGDEVRGGKVFESPLAAALKLCLRIFPELRGGGVDVVQNLRGAASARVACRGDDRAALIRIHESRGFEQRRLIFGRDD